MRITIHTLQRILSMLLLLAVTSVAALGQVQEYKITVDNSDGYRFCDATLDGTRMLVGVPWDGEQGDRAGAAYVFEQQASGTWMEAFKILPDDVIAGDAFGGVSVLAGDLAFVGVPYLDREKAGVVYVFARQPAGEWAEIQKLKASNGADGDRFGSAVDIHNGRLFVGAEYRDDAMGAVYVFEQDASGSWVEVDELVATQRHEGERFGRSVSVWNDVAIVTSFRDDFYTGSVYAFERQGNDWVETSTFRPRNTAYYDGFGQTSDIWENQLIVGSNGPNPSNSAYIFEQQPDGSWLEMAEFYGFYFHGEAVAIENGRAVIGAYLDEPPAVKGAAYIVDRQEGGTWVEVARVLAGDGDNDDGFGDCVALGGDMMLVGAPGDDDEGENAGAIYVYDLSDFNLIAGGFSLIDAETNQVLPEFDPIPEGAVLNIKHLPRYLNIRANATRDVESVRFTYVDNRGRDRQHIENEPPFALYGDNNGDYNDSSLPLGHQTIIATPFSMDNARGDAGEPVSVSFTVVREDPGLAVTRFVLVDAEQDLDMWTLRDGMTIDVNFYEQLLNVRAEVLGPVESVRFTLEPAGLVHTENVAPYALYGDMAGDYAGQNLATGTYTLQATAFKHPNATGQAGETYSVTFDVIDSGYRSPGARADGGMALPQMLPETTMLDAAYPNPFNPVTTLRFGLVNAAEVRLVVYDMLGREVETLIDGLQPAGFHEVGFHAANLPSGAYLYRLETPAGSFTRSMLLLK